MNDRPSAPPRRVGVTFNPRLEGARDLAYVLEDAITSRGIAAWVEDEAPPHPERSAFAGTDLMICLGGDGTVLRCARLVTGMDTLILGINLGRLGFLTEMDGAEALERLDEVLGGGGRIEERTMLQATVTRTGERFHGLNEAVIGRATLSRAIQLAVDVDGTRIADYRCDGVIVASATGSTAYALSVGGPILHPESRDLVIVPVAPHLAARHALVLPGSETVHVTLEPRQSAVLTVDGEADVQLDEGDSVLVTASEHRARFLRLQPHTDFYQRMAAQLGWHRPGGKAQPLPAVNTGLLGTEH
jgi:NAD+ kinase